MYARTRQRTRVTWTAVFVLLLVVLSGLVVRGQPGQAHHATPVAPGGGSFHTVR